jgi:hypothetical protein
LCDGRLGRANSSVVQQGDARSLKEAELETRAGTR